MSNSSFLRARTRRWLVWTVGTPATAVTFCIAAVTGVMLLFKLQLGPVRAIHEWMSLLFVVVSVLHTVRNWSALCSYFRTRTGWAVLAVTAGLAALFFLIPGEPARGRDAAGSRGALRLLGAASMAELAPIVKVAPAALVTKLRQQGLTVSGPEATVREIAQASQRTESDVIGVLYP